MHYLLTKLGLVYVLQTTSKVPKSRYFLHRMNQLGWFISHWEHSTCNAVFLTIFGLLLQKKKKKAQKLKLLPQLAPTESCEIIRLKSHFSPDKRQPSVLYYGVIWGGLILSLRRCSSSIVAISWLTHQLCKSNSEIRLATFGCHGLEAHRHTNSTSRFVPSLQTRPRTAQHSLFELLLLPWNAHAHSNMQHCMRVMTDMVEISIQHWSHLQSCHLWFYSPE